MRAYHFIDCQYGLDNIRRKRLKVSRLQDLNDPFELLALELPDKRVRNAFSEVKEQLHKNRGILCFSEKWSNPVMWSHYAEKHRGLCLVFEIPEKLLASISYSQKRLKDVLDKLFSNLQEVQEDAMARILTTKFSHWKYEKERRLFVGLDTPDEFGNHFVDFSEQLKLVGVIVGPRSAITRADLSAVLSHANLAHPIKVFKARLAFNSFRVVKNQDANLWQ